MRFKLPGLLLGLLLGSEPAHADAIATSTTTTPFPGVELVVGTTQPPVSHFVAARVALCATGIAVDATQAPSQFTTPRAWGDSVGAQIAVNGDFFVAGPRVHGQAVGGGVPWPLDQTGADPAVADAPYYRKYGWIAFGPGWVEFNHTGYVKQHPDEVGGIHQGFRPTEVTHDLPDGTLALVSGYSELVTEGKVYQCTDGGDDPTSPYCFLDRADLRRREPRTAMGLSEDRRTFILLVVDGRSDLSAGTHGLELGAMMAELGAWQAFNLDGGGSSLMWADGMGVLNQPSDATGPRAVANHWGVFASGAGDPRSCMAMDPMADGGPGAGGDGGPGRDAGGDGAGASSGIGGGCATAADAGWLAALLLLFLIARLRRSPRA